MQPVPGGASRLRILALFPHPRHIGHVVLDPDGLVIDGSFASRVRRFPSLVLREAALERLLLDSVDRHAPTMIVVVRAMGSAWRDAMSECAIRVAAATHLPVRVRYEAAVAELFVDKDAAGYDRLGQAVTRVFFPELLFGIRSWRRGEEDRRRRTRPVWKAAAGALAVMAELAPAAVAALAREKLPAGLASLIERAPRAPSV